MNTQKDYQKTDVQTDQLKKCTDRLTDRLMWPESQNEYTDILPKDRCTDRPTKGMHRQTDR